MVVVVVQMAPFKREIKLQKTVGEGIRIQKILETSTKMIIQLN